MMHNLQLQLFLVCYPFAVILVHSKSYIPRKVKMAYNFGDRW